MARTTAMASDDDDNHVDGNDSDNDDDHDDNGVKDCDNDDDIKSTKQDDIYETLNIVLPCPGS